MDSTKTSDARVNVDSLWRCNALTPPPCGARNPGVHWKRRGHRGEEEDTEEDLTKDMDDSSAGASMEEGSMSKNSE